VLPAQACAAISRPTQQADRSDWLDFCLPTGMLELIYPSIHYPLERASNPWMDELDRILLALAEEVYAVVFFSFELVGKGVSGTHSTSEISARRAASGTPVCSRRLGITLSPLRSGRDDHRCLHRGVDLTRDVERARIREDDGLLIATVEVDAFRVVEITRRAARCDELAVGTNHQLVRASGGVIEGDGVASLDGDAGIPGEDTGSHRDR
jgi:hypothetical protein